MELIDYPDSPARFLRKSAPNVESPRQKRPFRLAHESTGHEDICFKISSKASLNEQRKQRYQRRSTYLQICVVCNGDRRFSLRGVGDFQWRSAKDYRQDTTRWCWCCRRRCTSVAS